MTTELDASQTERGTETGTNVGQPWEAKFMTLERLPLLCEADRVLFHQWQERQKELFEEWHEAEVEALQARVRELEGALAKAQIALHQVCVDEANIGRVQPTTVNKVADARDRIAEARATLEGKD